MTWTLVSLCLIVFLFDIVFNLNQHTFWEAPWQPSRSFSAFERAGQCSPTFLSLTMAGSMDLGAKANCTCHSSYKFYAQKYPKVTYNLHQLRSQYVFRPVCRANQGSHHRIFQRTCPTEGFQFERQNQNDACLSKSACTAYTTPHRYTYMVSLHPVCTSYPSGFKHHARYRRGKI